MNGATIRPRLWLAGILLAEIAGCRSAPPVLPPIPASSGLVMTTPGEAAAVPAGQTLIDRGVAVVNGDILLMSELQEAVFLYQHEVQGAPAAGEDSGELQRKVLARMIDQRLQLQEARREKVEVGADDVRAVVDDFVKRNGGDREKIGAEMRAQGLTWDALSREYRDQLLVQRIRGRRVSRRTTVTESEVDAYMAENRAKLEAGLKYHARHIAVQTEPPEQPAAWERAKVEIDALVARLRDGAEFASLARERPGDASAASGGDLGWLARGELESSFEGPLLALPPGGVTEPIKGPSGYHLFQLEAREELTPQLVAEARQQARDLLFQRKVQERLDEWLEGLRRKALIRIQL